MTSIGHRGERFESHRCEGSLESQCSIRRYEHVPRLNMLYDDGKWHLYMQNYDLDYCYTYMDHVAEVRFCPWCGKRLDEGVNHG